MGDLLPPSAAAPAAAAPHWLVHEQREHVRTAGSPPPPPDPAPRRPAAPPDLSSDAAALIRRQRVRAPRRVPHAQTLPPDQDDDLILVDLLDGAHLPTREHHPRAQGRMSANSDSIISLPPMDERAASWGEMRARAQRDRRSRRASHSIGGFNVPDYMQAMRRPRSPVPTAEPPAQRAPAAPSRLPSIAESHSRENLRAPAVDIVMPVSEEGAAQEVRPVTQLPRGRQPKEHVRDRPVAGKPRSASRVPPTPDRLRDANLAPVQGENSNLLGGQRDPVKVAHHKRIHMTRRGSFHIQRDMFMVDDNGGHSTSTGGASNKTPRHDKGGKKRQRERRSTNRGDFRPGAWGWRMPAEEDVVMPSGSWIYLPLIGMLTFVVAYSVNTSAHFIANSVIVPLGKAIGRGLGGSAAMWATGSLRGVSLAISFLLVFFISPQYSAGSGIPEMKCVLSGVFMPKMLNLRTLIAKTVGLAFSLASAISIGRLGPFIHMSGIIAALVSKIPWFSALHNSARFQLQALSAAMAAGVGATFGAPIGGTLLSIEVMSTYYYVHWLPMALYCSVMGYFLVISLVQVDKRSFFPVSADIDLEFTSGKRLLLYIALGAVCGVAGAALVQFTRAAFNFRRKYFTNATPVRTTVMVAWFALFHTLVVASFGGIMVIPQRTGVGDLFSENEGVDPWLSIGWRPFETERWNSISVLFLSFAVKFVLTGLSLIMPVPAGTFMPIFETGALLGRVFGEFCSFFAFMHWVDPKVTAIVGAAALTSGALHTTSVAVVMLELTREAIDVLPLVVGVLVSYGVSKQLCSDLFSEFIKIRRLPFILGLRERYPSENHQFYEDVSTVVAGSFMSTDFPYVTPFSTRGEVFQMLTVRRKPWITCAFLSDDRDRWLWGTITQENLWKALGNEGLSSSESFDEEHGYGSMGRGQGSATSDEDYIPLLKNFDPTVGSPSVDMGPMQVSHCTPFWKIVTLFRMLSMSTMYVMKDGVTVGCVSKAQVISHSIQIEDRAKRKRERVRQAQAQRARDEKELLRQLQRDPQTSKRLASRMSGQDLVNMCSAASAGKRSRQGSFSTRR